MGLFKRKTLQVSAFKSAGSSSDLAKCGPSSGLTFVDNSKGALQAIEEVSQVLDETFKEIELEGTASEQLEEYQARLNAEAERYANSSVDCCNNKKSWSCDKANSTLVSIAWECAAGAYETSYALGLEDHRFQPITRLPPSFGGTIKATTMTLVDSWPSSDSSPILVVAIRGTASTVDIMVNLNSTSCVAEEFLVPGLAVHAGFLGAAQALEPHVSKCIAKICLTGQAKRVLFTGHSAGAAVASLLFLHYRKKYSDSLLLSCVLFGCPPIFQPSPSLPNYVLKPATGELWLNIINEYDVVSRADRPYVRSLVDLFRSGYGKSPLDPKLDSLSALSVTSDVTEKAGFWTVPLPEYRHGGDIIVLQMSRSSAAPTNVLGDDDPRMEAWNVPWDEFSQLLFTKVAVHRRRYYERAVSMIGNGVLSH